MIRPTPWAVALFALSIPLAIVIVVALPDWWHLSIYPPVIALILMGMDLALALPRRRLAVGIETPSRLFIGETGQVVASLSRQGGREPFGLTALLELTGDAKDPAAVTAAMPGTALSLKLAVVPLRRGRVRVEALWLRWRGPFGLVAQRTRLPLDKTIDIVPDVHGIHEAAAQFFSRDAVHGVKSQRMRGEGAEFDKLADFEPGMDSRFIDWKRSARHRKLLCKQFRQERNHQIVLGFDTGHLMLEPINGLPKLDHAIRAGLLLGWISLHGGDLVGGCGFDARFRTFIQPGRGMPYFTQFQRFAAGLDYHTEETNFTLGLTELNARLGRRALVVLFSEFVDAIAAELLLESLQLMTRRHAVVFVTMRDPLLTRLREEKPDRFDRAAEAVIADDFIRDRAIVLERVARLGVHCLDVSAEGMSMALLNRYLLIKQRGVL